jgi:hypothetical protein
MFFLNSIYDSLYIIVTRVSYTDVNYNILNSGKNFISIAKVVIVLVVLGIYR